jgi:hypothetical protein
MDWLSKSKPQKFSYRTMLNLNHHKIDQSYSIAGIDQRAYVRVETSNLISYAAINRGGNLTYHRMGRALDVSQNGIYLETGQRVESEYVSLMTSDAEQKLIEIKGKVAYSQKNGEGMFRTGIRLEGTHDENIQFAMKLIRVYHKRRTGYHISTDRSDRF